MEINHPKHYNQYPVEVIDMMINIWGKEATRTFCLLNAFKYRMRVGHKDDIQADLAKEQWYLDKAEELRDETANDIILKYMFSEQNHDINPDRMSRTSDMEDAASADIRAVLYPPNGLKEEIDQVILKDRERKCNKWWIDKIPIEVNGVKTNDGKHRIVKVTCRYNPDGKIEAIVTMSNLTQYVVVPDDDHQYLTQSRVKTLKERCSFPPSTTPGEIKTISNNETGF